MSKFKPIIFDNFEIKKPIIQGGMGVGVSLSNLAGAVSKAGGMGVISGAQIGFKEPDFLTNTLEANTRALNYHIKKAKEIAKGAPIGVNLMVVMNNYKEMVEESIKAGADFIISGAGLPLKLPEYAEDKIKIAPIVSSAKALKTITKRWMKKYSRLPDMVVIEGQKAGGHLGFKPEVLLEEKYQSLSEILKDVKQVVADYNDKYKKNIPIIVAGGINTKEEVEKYINEGADGVQIATLFVATEECDAHENFKQKYIDSKKEDIIYVKSPVGLMGRAIKNDFTKLAEKGRIPVKRCYNCMETCNPATTKYCISDALIKSVTGDVENGLVFCGAEACDINRIKTVKEVIDELL